MGDVNPIRTFGDYSKPSHEGYRNTIGLPLAIGLNIFQQDPSPHGKILLRIFLLNSFHRKGLQNSKTTSLCFNNIKENLSQKHGLVSRTYYKKSLIMASTFGPKSKSLMTMSLPPQDEPLTNQPVCLGVVKRSEVMKCSEVVKCSEVKRSSEVK
ncbi:hypothetical protein Tco_1271029 [Tanacetum coccineum]